MSKRVLLIQTAFAGDVILMTAMLEKLASEGDYLVDVLVRKGNETLLHHHPHIRRLLTWNKKSSKLKNLAGIIRLVRKERYDEVINLQRFFSSGLITVLSRGKAATGFGKNPLSFLFTRKVKHEIQKGVHETDRNQRLISHLTDQFAAKPRLYPTEADLRLTASYRKEKYHTISPGSVWPTKTFPAYKWMELATEILKRDAGLKIYLLGSAAEFSLCEEIRSYVNHENVINLAGSFTFLQSAAVIAGAQMNYVNDSAPLHLASAMNAPVKVVFCSTVPEFGFGPLSSQSEIIQTKEPLDCKPCGLHGYRECPLVHFRCAHTIDINSML